MVRTIQEGIHLYWNEHYCECQIHDAIVRLPVLPYTITKEELDRYLVLV
jgi:hypothetical protein